MYGASSILLVSCLRSVRRALVLLVGRFVGRSAFLVGRGGRARLSSARLLGCALMRLDVYAHVDESRTVHREWMNRLRLGQGCDLVCHVARITRCSARMRPWIGILTCLLPCYVAQPGGFDRGAIGTAA